MSADLRLPDLIDRTAADDPDREAVQFLQQSSSYAELSTQSSQLAHALRSAGVRRGDRVGILAPKRLETALSLYGIMKAGATYVPIDPSAPLERQAFVIRDCGIKCLVTAPSQLNSLRELEICSLPFEAFIGLDSAEDLYTPCHSWEEVFTLPSTSPDLDASADDLAYIIYTSGSTGTPKGIMHTHRSGLAFAQWAAAAYDLTPEDRLSNHAPLHFDLSIFDYFAGAVAGATTVIIPEAYTKLPASYTKLLEDAQVSVLFTVPFAFIQMHLHGVLDDRDLSNLRWAIYGGEPFSPKHLRALMERLPHVAFDNMYGPAEINGCSHFTVPSPPQDDHESIPIGPLNSICKGLIVDKENGAVEDGGIGELLVCTPTMMQGYWSRGDLNAVAFHRHGGDLYYRTGDLVRNLPSGDLVFIGRSDRQIKTRGYRVELDEVEAVLTAHEAVAEAAAFPLQNEGTTSIAAAVTTRKTHSLSAQQILQHAKSRLPWYAVPSSIAIETEFPRTTTGKIDRRALQQSAQRLFPEGTPL